MGAKHAAKVWRRALGIRNTKHYDTRNGPIGLVFRPAPIIRAKRFSPVSGAFTIMTPLSNLALLLYALALSACTTVGHRSAAGNLPAEPVVSPAARAKGTEAQGPFVPAIIGIPSDPGPSSTYRINPFDLLEITVFQVPELSREERVNEEGFVLLPLIGNIQVGGLTKREAEALLAAELGREYLQNPQVSLFVKEFAGQKVTVTGKVNGQGVIPLRGRTTLTQVIARAGGLSDVANDNEVLVFRKQENGEVNAYVVDFEAVEKGDLADPVIVDEDRIVVSESGTAVVVKTARGLLTGIASHSIYGLF